MAPDSTRCRIQCFGSPCFFYSGEPVQALATSRLQSLLVYLVLKASTPQPREQLAALLWPESEEGQARTNLRQLLHHLRRGLPADARLLATDTQSVQWPRDASWTADVHEFDDALARAGLASGAGDAAKERVALAEAAALYQDDLARGLFDDWLAPIRDHYRERFESALARLAELHERFGDLPAAIRCGARLVAQDPLREAHHRLLIRLYLAANDRASALRAYHQCLRLLRRELGVDPDPATQELYQRALKGEARASAGAAAIPIAVPVSSTLAPLVGRARPMESLLDCWRETLSGRARLAIVMGEPGIGKSRLVEELAERVALPPGAKSFASARCYAAQGRLAYAPVAEWLGSPALRAGCLKLPEAQKQELARVLPEIVASRPDGSRARTGEAWERRHFHEALHAAFRAAPRPCLLVIDDLQWCDADTIDYLQILLQSEPRQLLIAATLRPEETDREHPVSRLRSELGRTNQLTEIRLGPLTAEETSALAVQTSQSSLSARDLADLYNTTRGNPLFVVECVRAGLRSPDATRRIHAVIAARLAQLSQPAWELVGLAATVGQSFSTELLGKAGDWEEESLTRALDELWRRRLIDGLDDGLYDFTHDRIRESAEAELSPVRRRYFHKRIAGALEEMHRDNVAGVSVDLAAHYDKAGMPREAIARYREAASVARVRFADKEAAALLRKALDLCGALPDSRRREQELDLLVTLGSVLVTTLGYAMPEVGETYARALSLSESLGEKVHLPFVLSGSWVFHAVRGDLESSRGFAEQLRDLASRERDEALMVAGDFTLGSSLFHLGRLAESHGSMARTLSRYGNISHSALALFGGPDVGVFGQSYLAHLWWHLGHPDLAAAASAEAIKRAERVGHPFSLAIALDYAALLAVFRGDSPHALAQASDAIALCRKHDFAYYLSIAEIAAGWAVTFEGDPPAGLRQLRAALERFRNTGAELRLPFYHGLLAEVWARNGNMAEALASLSSGFAYQSGNGEMWSGAHLHRIQGDLLQQAGNGPAAHASYRKSLEAARLTGAAVFETIVAERLKSIS